eukprot:2417618-Amphidinium_carterae.1
MKGKNVIQNVTTKDAGALPATEDAGALPATQSFTRDLCGGFCEAVCVHGEDFLCKSRQSFIMTRKST